MKWLSINRVIEIVTAHGYEVRGDDVVEVYTCINEDGSMGQGERLRPLSAIRDQGILRTWLRY